MTVMVALSITVHIHNTYSVKHARMAIQEISSITQKSAFVVVHVCSGTYSECM